MKKIIISLLVVLIPLVSYAHSGRTNSSGCHNDNINGGYHCHKSDHPPREVSSLEDYEVSFNQKSHKYHRLNCKSAKGCTVNCISLKKSQAIERGGQPCGNCGG